MPAWARLARGIYPDFTSKRDMMCYSMHRGYTHTVHPTISTINNTKDIINAISASICSCMYTGSCVLETWPSLAESPQHDNGQTCFAGWVFFPRTSFLFAVSVDKPRNAYLSNSKLHGHDKQNIKSSTLEGVDPFGYAWHGVIKINLLQKT